MIKKLLIILILATGCCQNQIKPNNIAFNMGYGEDTCLGDLSKTDKGKSYNMSTFSVEFIKDYDEWLKSLELSFIDHSYNYDGLKHSNSFSFKIWAMKKYSLNYIDSFIGIGAGLGYTNPTKNNKYLADSNITSDLGFRAGLQKTFKYFNIRLEYMFRHFSAVWKDDSGENLDEVRIGFVFPF